MISEKMIKMTQNSSAIRAMFEEGNRLAEKYGRENVFDFSLGNPNFPAPEKVKQAAMEILEKEDPMALHGYMANAGYPEVRTAVAESLNKRFDTAYNANNIIMTVGAAGGLNIVLKTLLNPGDEVITFAPYFVEYNNYVNNYDGILKPIYVHHDTFRPSASELEREITPKTKAIIINNPNNPTGVVYPKRSIERLAAVLEKKQQEYGKPIYIISDEPYRELVYDGIEVPYIPNIYRNTIVCYSWSKALSLPGERIGYVAIPDEADDAALIINAATIANRILGFVNAPSLMQKVVAECLEEKTDISAYDENRKLIYNALTEYGFDCIYPSGAFYLWIKAPTDDDKEFTERAKKYNILLVGGASFACPGYVRLAYCVSPEMIRRSLPGFKKLAAEYGLNKE